jgi:hypothetical protein
MVTATLIDPGSLGGLSHNYSTAIATSSGSDGSAPAAELYRAASFLTWLTVRCDARSIAAMLRLEIRRRPRCQASPGPRLSTAPAMDAQWVGAARRGGQYPWCPFF